MTDKTKYHLVASADLRTWSTKNVNLLFGPWCEVLNFKKKELKKYRYEVLPHTENPFFKSKNDDRHFFANITTSYLSYKYKNIFNEIHDLNYSNRYWKIISLSFIQIFSDTFSEIYIKLDEIFKKYDIESAFFYNFDYDQQNIPFDWLDSYIALKCNDKVINWLIHEIIKFKNFDIEISYIKYDGNDFFISNQNDEITYHKNYFIDKIKLFISKFLEKLPKSDNGPLIIGSMLPIIQESLFKISNYQFPVIYPPKFPEKNYIYQSQRRKKKDFQDLNLEKDFNQFVYNLSLSFAPICYIEDFKKISNQALSLGWPKSPSYILTSSYIYSNELLKFYCAEKTEIKKTSLHLVQHGHHYSTRNMLSIESQIADKFLLWGEKKISKNDIPLYCSKIVKKNNYKISKNQKKIIFMISTPEENKSALMGIDLNNHAANQKFLFETLSRLDKEVRKSIICRLRHNKTKNFCGDENAIKVFDPELEIETGDEPVKRFYNKGKLIIHCYDSTGFLETIAMNKPTLLFFHEYEFDQFRDSEVYYDYMSLIDLEILHLSPESLSNKINLIFNDVRSWWLSDKIQNNLSVFREKYSNTSTSPIRDLLYKNKI